MNASEMDPAALQEFLSSPDTVDFVLRSNALNRVLQKHPSVVSAQVLEGRYIICYATTSVLREIVNTFGSSFVSSVSSVLGLLDRPSLEASGITQAQEQPYLGLKGKGVLLGFLDTGIDYTQEIFRNPDGTSRIQYLCDLTQAGPPPEGFYMGVEYTNDQINQALLSQDPSTLVPQKDTVGHGTFLASVAAGGEMGTFIGAAPESELVIVKLRKARPFYLDFYTVPPDQENAFESTSVMLAVDYIIQKARSLDRPVVICIGLGTNFSSHDGFGIFEEYLSIVSNLRGVCICTAAGNESQARHHTTGTLPEKGSTQNIDLNIGNDAGDISIQIWNTISDKFSISIRSPTGELMARVPSKPGLVTQSSLILEESTVQVQYFFPYEGSGGQLSIVKIFNATPGIWTITLNGDIILNGSYHAWLPLTGFVSPDVEFLSATPYYTVTSPSTMLGGICVGGYNHTTNSLYSNSSWGPTRSERLAPDLVAPAVGIGGFFPSGYGRMTGTSVAAAITSGSCAQMMEWGIVKGNDKALSTYQIRAYLIRGCAQSPTIIYPNTQWGYGTLDLLQTFNLMREI